MVVIIIGILATFAIPEYNKFKEKAYVVEAIKLLGVEVRKFLAKEYTAPLYGFGDFESEQPVSQYWWYMIGSSGGEPRTDVQFYAIRKDGPYSGAQIMLTLDLATHEITWSGDHPGVPKN